MHGHLNHITYYTKMNKVIEEAVVVPDETTKETSPKKERKLYENSHLVMYCGKCNSRYTLEENIPGDRGVSINLPPASDAEFVLACRDCGNKMGIFYVEAVKTVKGNDLPDKEPVESKEYPKGKSDESVRKVSKKK